MRKEVLRMVRVALSEGSVAQLEDFNLNIFEGEIMGLIPLNNQGLTSLLKLLQHNSPLSAGYVYYRDTQINSCRSVKLRENRIGMIQGESSLIDDLTVADNIFVLRSGFRKWFISPRMLRRQLMPVLESVEIDISADTYVEQLSEFERMVVNILKAVVAGYRLIVLRDISAKISELELEKLRWLVSYYAALGISFLYIDFHFEELQQICDRVALMSNGTIVKIFDCASTAPETLQVYTKSYDNKVHGQLKHTVSPAARTRPVFEARGLAGLWRYPPDFSVSAGECLVLQDVDNGVLSELLTLLRGDATPDGGQFFLGGKPYTPALGREIALIDEFPIASMLFPHMSYLDNLSFTLNLRQPTYMQSKVRRSIRQEYGQMLGEELMERRVDRLSEKEKYQLVYQRIALQRPKVVFCVQPFRRADVDLRMYIWEQIDMLRRREIGVVILSINLADSLSLADRLIRLYGDRPPEAFCRSEFSSLQISAPWRTLYQQTEQEEAYDFEDEL